MRKMQYRLFLEPSYPYYLITNNFNGAYGEEEGGDVLSPPIKITSHKGLGIENLKLDCYDADDPIRPDTFKRILRGEQSDWILTSIQIGCSYAELFCKNLPRRDFYTHRYLSLLIGELKDVEFTCEVERDDGLPADKYLIKGIDDGHDYRNEFERHLSRYSPCVTEWDGHKKREVTITREPRNLSDEYANHDYWACITEYC
jgi:hypothetical protein